MNVNKRLFISLTITGLLLAGCANNTKPVEPNNPPVIEEKEDFKDVYFDDMTFFYDGKGHTLNEVKGAPEGTLITYNGRETKSEIGIYNVTATLSKDGYNDLTLSATMKIIDGHKGVVDIDPNKKPYTFKETPMWDETFNEVLKGNYTLLVFSGSRESLEEPIILNDENYGTLYASDGINFYQTYYSSLSNTNIYEYYNVIDDDAICHYFEGETIIEKSKSKLPAAALEETFIKRYVAAGFIALQPADDGSIISGVDLDDYYSDVGTFEVSGSSMTIKHEHKHGSSYFYEIFKFYNVGNTVLNIPNSLYPSREEIKDIKMNNSDFFIDGVRYGYHLVSTWNSPYVYMAHTYLYHWLQLILEPGTHFVYPAIYDTPIVRVVYSYYSETNIYNYDMSGYELNVCFDENGYYQGEYEQYGEVVDKTSSFVSHGGLVHYYSEWHS